jgi:hypothetical protein
VFVSQRNFTSHCASDVHFVAHAVPAQTNGVHAALTMSSHFPFPVHVAATTATPAVHDAARHGVSVPVNPWQ